MRCAACASKWRGAFAADDEVAVVVVAQPLHAFLGGDAAVHHHQGLARGVECVEHLGERAVFTHVAGKHFGAAYEAARVEHQGQGEQWAVGTLVLGVPAFGLGLERRLAFEEGVGQVVQRDGGMEVEQPHGLVEQVVLDGLAVRHQRIGGAIELHGSHGLEVHLQQLAQGATLAEPAPGGALGARTCHAGDNGADGRCAQRRADAQRLEQGAQPELVHRPQCDMLDADRARAHEFERIDVDALDIVCVGRRGGAGALAGEESGGDALGVRFERRGAIGVELELPGEHLVDASAQHRPGALPDGEVSSQVEQGALSHLRADPLGAYEAEGEVRLAGAGAAGLGAPDEHAGRVVRGSAWCNPSLLFYGTTSAISTNNQSATCQNRRISG